MVLHHAEKRIVMILDRKPSPGRPPKVPIADLPCQYLVRYQNHDKFYDEWLTSDETYRLLENASDEYAIECFEEKYPRLNPDPCRGVERYRDPTGIDVAAVRVDRLRRRRAGS